MNNAAVTPQPAPVITGPVLLVVAGGAVSQAAIARTAELAAGAPVTVVGIDTSGISQTGTASRWPAHPARSAVGARQPGGSPRCSPRAGNEPEQVRRTVALAMSVLEDTGVMAMGHIVTGSPARAVARMARVGGTRVVILDQPRPSGGGQSAIPGASMTAEGRSAGTVRLMAELRRRMYGSGIIVLAETDRRGGWVSV
jgi:hypothetical protein